jgi:hypothetical protein
MIHDTFSGIFLELTVLLEILPKFHETPKFIEAVSIISPSVLLLFHI